MDDKLEREVWRGPVVEFLGAVTKYTGVVTETQGTRHEVWIATEGHGYIAANPSQREHILAAWAKDMARRWVSADSAARAIKSLVDEAHGRMHDAEGAGEISASPTVYDTGHVMLHRAMNVPLGYTSETDPGPERRDTTFAPIYVEAITGYLGPEMFEARHALLCSAGFISLIGTDPSGKTTKIYRHPGALFVAHGPCAGASNGDEIAAWVMREVRPGRVEVAGRRWGLVEPD